MKDYPIIPLYDFVPTFPVNYNYMTLRDHLLSIHVDPQIIADYEQITQGEIEEDFPSLRECSMGYKAVKMFRNSQISVDQLLTFIRLGIVGIWPFLFSRDQNPRAMKEMLNVCFYAGGDTNKLIAYVLNNFFFLEEIFPDEPALPDWLMECDTYIVSGLFDPKNFMSQCRYRSPYLRRKLVSILRHIGYIPPSKIDLFYNNPRESCRLKDFIDLLEEFDYPFRETETTFDYDYFRKAFETMEKTILTIFPRPLDHRDFSVQHVMNYYPIPELAAKRMVLVAKIFAQRPLNHGPDIMTLYANSPEKDWEDSYQLRKKLGLVSREERPYQREYC